MAVVYVLLLAYIGDLFIGDPRWLPHPVTGIARAAWCFEKIFRKLLPTNLYIAGGLTTLLTVALTVVSSWVLLHFAFVLSFASGCAAATVLLYYCLATKSLLQHSKAVYAALVPQENLELARNKVAMIVGRETQHLSAEKVVKATVESVAENLVDGITAPLLWAVFLSFFSISEQGAVMLAAVGAMGYKSINTMDSMFGYRNEKYLQFGWAAARLDDIANFLPARISGFLILLSAFLSGKNVKRGSHVFFRDRLNHLSPNAGHSEAAVAGILGLQFGGPSVYHGKIVEKPYIGDRGGEFKAQVILETNRLILITSTVSLFLLLIVETGVWSLGQ